MPLKVTRRDNVSMSLGTVRLAAATALLLALLLLAAARGEPVTVDGSGFDWPYDSCHALDPHGDLLDATPHWYDSRDLLAWYYAVGDQYVFIRLDLLDLAYGAETASYPDGGVADALNIYVMLGWENAPGYQEWAPDYLQLNGYGVHISDYRWVVAIAVYDSAHYKVYRYDWSVLAENSGLQVAFNSQWDLVEIGIPRSMLESYGWTPTSRVWAKIATALVKTGGANVLADAMPNTVSFDGNAGRYEWSGAVFSDQKCGTAKVAFVHHGNQHLADNRALNKPNAVNSYDYILRVHEELSAKAGRRIPVCVHMSGTLAASYVWWDPSIVAHLRSLAAKGLACIVGGTWAEYITAYFYDNFNDPSFYLGKLYAEALFGYTPLTAWIPERTWDDERTGIAYTVSKHYYAVILDGNTHHDDWSPNTSPYKPHQYDPSKTGGRELYVFFIDWEMQQLLLANTDGGLNINLRRKLAWAATNADQQMLFLYADDWEKAAGISSPSWDPGNPYRYRDSLTWIAMHPWIQVVTVDEVVGWLRSGSWTPVKYYYCGYDTYYYLKTWVPGYPYDYRRAYDGWYWGTSSAKSFAWYGSGQPGYSLPDTTMPFGDVFGYTTYNGSPANTVIYRLLAPGKALDSAPRNELWRLAVMAANALLYETAWHEGSDCVGWGLNQWNHLRLVNVLLLASKWLDDARLGKIAGASYLVGDFDWDGRPEAVIYNRAVFAYIDDKGGAAPLIFAYNRTTDRVYVSVGAPLVYWGVLGDAWYGDNHVGFLADDYFDATGKNYYSSSYQLVSASRSDAEGGVVVKLAAPDMDGDGRPDFYKYFVLRDTANYVDAVYEPSGKAGTVYSAVGLSVDLLDSLFNGDRAARVGDPSGASTFGYRNGYTGAYAYVKPLQGASWTGPQDLSKYTLQYVAKLAVSVSQGQSKVRLYLPGDPGQYAPRCQPSAYATIGFLRSPGSTAVLVAVYGNSSAPVNSFEARVVDASGAGSWRLDARLAGGSLGSPYASFLLNLSSSQLAPGMYYVELNVSLGASRIVERAYSVYVRRLERGYNLVSLPFFYSAVVSPSKASELAETAGTSLLAVWRWDVQAQRFRGYVPGVSGPEDDFPLEPGSGYFVYAKSPVVVVWVAGKC